MHKENLDSETDESLNNNLPLNTVTKNSLRLASPSTDLKLFLKGLYKFIFMQHPASIHTLV